MSLAEDQKLRMTRRFARSPEALFDAWLKPEVAAKWLFTTPGSEAHATEIDAQVGGKWTITDRRDGVDYRALGEYVEIDRPRRLVFTFGMPQFSPGFTRVTVEIAADGPGAVLTLTQEGLPPEHIPATEHGWSEMLEAMLAALP